MEALLEELRRSQDRLRKEVLAGQAAILCELRSLHHYWKQQLGAVQGSRAEVSAEVSAEPVSKVSEEAVERKLSEGLQDFTDSIVRAPRRLCACTLAVPGGALRTPIATSGIARSERSVRFDPEPPSPSPSEFHGDAAHAEPEKTWKEAEAKVAKAAKAAVPLVTGGSASVSGLSVSTSEPPTKDPRQQEEKEAQRRGTPRLLIRMPHKSMSRCRVL
ncbi:unnamed protein product [Symbiodinium sp. CCMP2456]|nr:unnamed protein product [Symbiodinium sp. CCMP2456]